MITSQPRPSGIQTTGLPTPGSTFSPREGRQAPGRLKPTMWTSGSRWTLVIRRKSPRYWHKGDQSMISGWKRTRCRIVRMASSLSTTRKTDKRRSVPPPTHPFFLPVWPSLYQPTVHLWRLQFPTVFLFHLLALPLGSRFLISFHSPNCFFPLKEFTGNTDRNSVVEQAVAPAIEARFIRIQPATWHNHISMRTEFKGCAAGKIVLVS